MKVYDVKSMAHRALNEAVRQIQNTLGVKTGDTAGMFFSGSVGDQVLAVFEDYINTEISMVGNPPLPRTVAETVMAMKVEILTDMLEGVVPKTVSSVRDLDDYVDLNCYGNFCDDEFADALIAHFGGRDEHEGMPQGMIDYINECQRQIDEWLEGGRK